MSGGTQMGVGDAVGRAAGGSGGSGGSGGLGGSGGSGGSGGRPRFDVIVLGGGINGTAIARDAAMRGFTVLLLEKDDISHATSAWNSRMIHGGLRYLEHYEFDLVRESLREREWLLHSAPHLVKPLPFLFPFQRTNKRSPWLLRMGMLAYDILSYDKSLPHFRLYSKKRALQKAPGLDPAQLRGGSLFYDAQVDFAERLSVENVISARDHGAQVLTHTRATRLVLEDARVVGVEYRDELTGAVGSAGAAVTVNAMGPWADDLLEGLPGHDRPLIGGTKGTHLVVDPFPGAPIEGASMYYEAVSDGRPVLVIPWQGRFLIGSTDIRYHGDAGEVRADDSEIDYILSETNLLFPGAGLTRDSVRFLYTGVRPLPYDPDDDPAKITRHHIVKDHAPAVEGLITIVGGKLTTFRSLGQDATDKLQRKLGVKRKCRTRKEALPGGRTADYRKWAAAFKASSGLPEPTAERLLSIYGVRAAEVAELARAEGMGAVVDRRSGALAAEVVHALRAEGTRTLTDVVMRRTMLGLDPELPAESVEAIVGVMARHESWPRGRAKQEIDAYRAYAARFRLAPKKPA
jgi:glycerol-3-phosphate dehydrogenase